MPELRLPVPWQGRSHLCWGGRLTRWLCVCVCVCVWRTHRLSLDCTSILHGLFQQCKPHKRPVCGSNGKTYLNHCELHRDACLTGSKIQVDYDGHCKGKWCSHPMLQLQPGSQRRSSVAWLPGVLSTPNTVPKAVGTTQLLREASPWCSWACWVCPGWPCFYPALPASDPPGGFPHCLEKDSAYGPHQQSIVW